MAEMNSDLNHLYQHIHASSTLMVDLPENIGTGRIIRTVFPCGSALSSWKMNYARDTVVEGNVKDDFRLLFCMGEGAAWSSDRKTMGLDRNEACLILDDGEMQSMCYTSGTQYEFWSVTLRRDRLFAMLADYIPEPGELLSGLKYKRFAFTPEIREVLFKNVQLLKASDRGLGMMRMEAHTQELIALCLETAAGDGFGRKGIHTDDADILRQVKTRIDIEPGTIPGITELGMEYGISGSKLARLFRQTYNIPLHSYVIESRLSEGAKLLSEGKLSVGEVSRRVGYVKQSQFSAAFKRRFHVLPRDY